MVLEGRCMWTGLNECRGRDDSDLIDNAPDNNAGAHITGAVGSLTPLTSEFVRCRAR